MIINAAERTVHPHATQRQMNPDADNWTRLYFTHRSPPGCVTEGGELTPRGLFFVLMDLSLYGNYGPVCKKGRRLYCNSDKWFPGRYYDLSAADEATVLDATARGLLELSCERDLGAYVDFTELGVRYALEQPLPPLMGSILGATDPSFLTTASRDVVAVCELVHRFETDLIKARSFDASAFTFQNVVSTLHKLMLDPKTASEHLTREHKRKIRGNPIQNNCSLFDLYVGQNASVLNSYDQGMFMSVSDTKPGSEYRLGKWHGGHNHLGGFNPLNFGGKSLTRVEWLDFKLFEVYGDDYTISTLLDVLRNNEVSHSSLSKRTSINRMLEIANRNLRGDGDVGPDDARGVHETLVHIGYNVGKLLRLIRCWRPPPIPCESLRS